MRFTLARLRFLLLASFALLLVALVAFLVVARHKSFLNRGDIPKQLDFEVKQEANGFTVSHNFGGHSQFKIHAAKAVELNNKHVLLHEVKIEIYGADGQRADQIEGSEFEYDEGTKVAVSKGPVEITLMRPGVTPAGSATLPIKPKSDSTKSKIQKYTPLASAAETAARGQIHVKTSGLIFDQKSGTATTDQHLDFSMVQGTGSAEGAVYDSDQGFLILDHSVVLQTKRGVETIVLHAAHAEFDRDTYLCRMRAATANFRNGRATGTEAKILFRQDGSAQRLDATGGFTLTTETGSHLAAPTGSMEFNAQNQPRHAHMEGGVAMDSASDVAGRKRQTHGTAPTAELEFTAAGLLRHAHLERGVAFDSEEQSMAAGQKQLLKRHWRSPIAEIEFRQVGKGQTEPASIHGLDGVIVTGESQKGSGPQVPSRLSADDLTGNFGPHSALTLLSGTGHAALEETTETGAHQTTSGDRLTAHFAAASQGNASQIQSATVDGHVVLTQTPAAKTGAPAPTTLHATAGRADYAGEGEWLHLTMNPRVEDGQMQLTADKIDVSHVSGDAFAHGNVKATWLEAVKNAKTSSNTVALGSHGPTHVVAAEAKLDHITNEATFTGHAHMWQQANSITAPVLVLDRERQSLTAHSTDAAEPVRVVLVSKDAGESTHEKQKPPTTVRVHGGDLRYSDRDRRALMTGGAFKTVTAETATATSVSREVIVVLLPAGANKNAATSPGQTQNQIDSVTARGNVVLTSEGRRGTGEQLVYTAATGEYVLTGTATVPPKMTDATRGTVTGEALIFHNGDDRVRVEGGRNKTTTETIAPK